MKRLSILSKSDGFTMVELIAVLLILGVLMAVAIPKYLDLMEYSKEKAAEVQLTQVKSDLNLAWGKNMLLNNGSISSVTPVLSSLGYLSGVESSIGSEPDIWKVTLTGADTAVIISVNARGGDTGYKTSGTWNMPAGN